MAQFLLDVAANVLAGVIVALIIRRFRGQKMSLPVWEQPFSHGLETW